ncbi:pentapeptide repeat-containing protein [Plebeiibacterium marinum]|uniref:Pentapeptide repeat-containing protein n=1 Tax=Plebeiibacterium marinum TaxID=2992111 RepID=A0AAE3MEB7_9BACT|nr:pentapeptide repeat-containing protein [Plebeiobacterium marinum]MCW3806224.1 pentapeptide repeat-containing protein [Plebeiobacterium marinum]
MSYIASDQIENINQLTTGEYNDCVFKNCDLSGSVLIGSVFEECEFINCNLSNVRITDVAFRDVSFVNCKLLGIQFSECNTFNISLSFKECILDFASFYRLKIKATSFINCRLSQVDFVEANLTKSSFVNCDLAGAVFERTNLQEVDFRTAVNVVLDPELNQLKKAKFSQNNISGLLVKYGIKID